MLWVPPGFAHGFYVTSEYADFQYKCTDIYHPASEVCLAWDDPTVAIDWPLPAGESPSCLKRMQRAWHGVIFRYLTSYWVNALNSQGFHANNGRHHSSLAKNQSRVFSKPVSKLS